MIYMDNAATSFPKPESVYQAMDDFNRLVGANPGRGSNQQSLKRVSVMVEAGRHWPDCSYMMTGSQIALMQCYRGTYVG